MEIISDHFNRSPQKLWFITLLDIQFSSVQSLYCVWLFVTPWTAAHQASLSLPISQSLLKLMSVESVMPPSHPLLSPSPAAFSLSKHQGSFPVSQPFTSGGQSIGGSASASVLPMNIQSWFPLGLTGLIVLLCKGFSGVFLKGYC